MFLFLSVAYEELLDDHKSEGEFFFVPLIFFFIDSIGYIVQSYYEINYNWFKLVV